MADAEARDEHAVAVARRVAQALIAREGTAKAWGMALEDVLPGYARVRMTVRADMLNGHGTAHGGMIFALADSAFAYACNARDVVTVAQSASIVFLTPARAGDVLIAEAREAMLAGRSGAYDVRVTTADGRDVASFHGLSRSVGGSVLERE